MTFLVKVNWWEKYFENISTRSMKNATTYTILYIYINVYNVYIHVLCISNGEKSRETEPPQEYIWHYGPCQNIIGGKNLCPGFIDEG